MVDFPDNQVRDDQSVTSEKIAAINPLGSSRHELLVLPVAVQIKLETNMAWLKIDLIVLLIVINHQITLWINH